MQQQDFSSTWLKTRPATEAVLTIRPPRPPANKIVQHKKIRHFPKILENFAFGLHLFSLTLRLAHPVHGIVGAHHHSHLLKVKNIQWKSTKVETYWSRRRKKCVPLTMSMSMHFLHPALWLIPALLHQTSTCWTIIKKWKVFKWWTNMPTWLENK